MEKQIKRTILLAKRSFIGFWLLPLLLILLFELTGETVGALASDVRATYLMETVSILLVAVCVPVSLKIFSWVMLKRIDNASIDRALVLYRSWSSVRLLLLSFPVIAGLLTYYLALSTGGLLCTLIALTASLFCVPGEKRLRRELHIDNETEA